MLQPLRKNDDILTSDRDAQYQRGLERARNLSYGRGAANDNQEKGPSVQPTKTLGSGLPLRGNAANDSPASGKDMGSGGKGNGILPGQGGGTGDNAVENLGSNVANAAVNAAIPGAGLSSLWNSDLPMLLRIMVAGKGFTRPGGIMILWPLLSLPFCFFGTGTLFFWMLERRKADGSEIKLADIKMGPLDFMILGVTLAIWGLISLVVAAIFGAI